MSDVGGKVTTGLVTRLSLKNWNGKLLETSVMRLERTLSRLSPRANGTS